MAPITLLDQALMPWFGLVFLLFWREKDYVTTSIGIQILKPIMKSLSFFSCFVTLFPLDVLPLSQPTVERSQITRRKLIIESSAALSLLLTPPDALASDLSSLVSELEDAKSQLQKIPAMIQAEQWDAVRNTLVTPPLSDLWTKSSVRRKTNLWDDYGEAVSANNGDEFAVLDIKEDLQGHLRFLDMAVYNNIFNPIATQGQTGASKGLIQSYYEDPMNEFRASLEGLEQLIKVGRIQ